jgi:hypothetical protein
MRKSEGEGRGGNGIARGARDGDNGKQEGDRGEGSKKNTDVRAMHTAYTCTILTDPTRHINSFAFPPPSCSVPSHFSSLLPPPDRATTLVTERDVAWMDDRRRTTSGMTTGVLKILALIRSQT